MPASLESPAELIARLFPFFVLFDLSDEPRIENAGDSANEWLGGLVGGPVAEMFAIVRPHKRAVSADSLYATVGEVVFLEHVPTGRRLRGGILTWGPERLMFVGSPLVTAEDKLENLDLRLADFAPHDATADIVIMAQFAKLQVRDIERQQLSIAQLAEDRAALDQTASTDPLTELANRRALWAGWESVRRSRGDEATQTLLYIDVDGFKQINDEHGHHIGDEVLKILAQRMRLGVKDRDMVGRLGGDEFVVLFDRLEPDRAAEVANRIQALLSVPVETSAGVVEISASMGLAHAQLGQELDEAIRDADTAMYRGRQRGRGSLTVFEPVMGKEREERRALTHDLRAALDRGDGIVPWFQPIVDVATGTVKGFEALARWFHPTRGLVRPDIFIGIAEGAGLVDRLDETILKQALACQSRWQEVQPGLTIHTNLSGRSLSRSTAPSIAAALDAAGVHARDVVIEVTESWFIDQHRVEILQAIADLGVGLQLDDFGTGYSSMTHLQAFPIGGLKIDRSFVSGIADNERDRSLVEATLSMARSLRLDVVAEGVETEAVAESLDAMGCEWAQGYLYSRPVPADEAVTLLGRSGLRSS